MRVESGQSERFVYATISSCIDAQTTSQQIEIECESKGAIQISTKTVNAGASEYIYMNQ